MLQMHPILTLCVFHFAIVTFAIRPCYRLERRFKPKDRTRHAYFSVQRTVERYTPAERTARYRNHRTSTMNEDLGLLWQPEGTFLTENTTLSKTVKVVCQSYESKDYIHRHTRVKHRNTFLILKVGNEEAVVGETKRAVYLHEILDARKPTMISVLELLTLCESTDLTKMDLVFRDQLMRDIDGLKEEGDEYARFFCKTSRYIKERIYMHA